MSEENSASVEEVCAGTEEMTAQVEEVGASAQTLADMAENLKGLVAKFKLETGQASSRVPMPSKTARWNGGSNGQAKNGVKTTVNYLN